LEEKAMNNNKHIGSEFDDSLRKEGILEEVEARAIKQIITYALQEEMAKNRISQTEMARRLGTSRSALKRLLDPNNYSVTLTTLSRTANTLGKKLKISLH
jgi:antitoxin HicB